MSVLPSCFKQLYTAPARRFGAVIAAVQGHEGVPHALNPPLLTAGQWLPVPPALLSGSGRARPHRARSCGGREEGAEGTGGLCVSPPLPPACSGGTWCSQDAGPQPPPPAAGSFL